LPGFKAIFNIDAPCKEKLRTLLELAVDLYEEDRDYYKIASTLLRSVFQEAIDNGDVPPHFSVDDLMLTFIGGTMGMATFVSVEGIEDKTSLRKGVEVMLASLKW
jgi:hypothetical protein